jgi:hypothetical protein
VKFNKTLSKICLWFFKAVSLIGFIFLCIGVGVRGSKNSVTDIDMYFIILGFIILLPLIIYIIKDYLISKNLSKKKKDN